MASWFFILFVFSVFMAFLWHTEAQKKRRGRLAASDGVTAATLATPPANTNECFKTMPYYVGENYSFDLCVGHNDQEVKDGSTINGVINTRGYLPTCRVLHMLLWMHAEASTEKLVEKGTFVDVGMNLGTCSAHIAMLGFPVVAVEPVDQHVHAMHSTLAMSPAMSVDVFFGGIAHAAGESKVQILSAGRNFGASKTVFVNEYTSEESRFQRNHVLELYTLDSLVNGRDTSLVKIDCEGCEWDALVGGRETLARAPMVKMEIVQSSWDNGTSADMANATTVSQVTPKHLLSYLEQFNFDFFWEPAHMSEVGMNVYFGMHKDTAYELDSAFGSKLNRPVPHDPKILDKLAADILKMQFFPRKMAQFRLPRGVTDVICIKKSVVKAMKKRFLPPK